MGTSVRAAEEATPQLIIDPRGHSGVVWELLFTPDGETLISLGEDKAIRFWDVDTGVLRKTLRLSIGPGNLGFLHAGALSPDGHRLFVAGRFPGNQASRGGIRAIDLQSNEIEAILVGDPGPVVDLAISDDGHWLASGGGQGIMRLWDLRELERQIEASQEENLVFSEAMEIEGHEEIIYSLSFAPGGERLVSGSFDKTAILWERSEATGKFEEKAKLGPFAGFVRDVAFSPDGEIFVTGVIGGRMEMWDGKTGGEVEVLETGTEAPIGQWALAFSPDGRQLHARTDSGPTDSAIYQLPSGRRTRKFTQLGNTAAGCWSPVGDRLAVANASGQIFVIEAESGEIQHCLESEGMAAGPLDFAEDGLRVFLGTSEEGHYTKLFDFQRWALDGVEQHAGVKVFDGAVREHYGQELEWINRELLRTAKGEIRTSTAAGEEILGYQGTPEGDIIVQMRTRLSLFEPNGDFRHDFMGHEGLVKRISLSPDDRFFATAGNDRTYRVWKMQKPPVHRAIIAGVGIEDDPEGVVVTGTIDGMPAQKAGLESGDRVMTVDGKTFTSAQALVEYTRGKSKGDRVVYRVRRGEEDLERTMTLEEYVVPPSVVRPLASLFVSRDAEWVCWLESGHYHASPGGEKYIGWHLNRGVHRMGGYYPSYVFRDQFHRPELVKRTILLGDFDKALAETGEKEVEDLSLLFPPKVEWVLPAEASSRVAEDEAEVRARISSPNGELTRVKLLLNGKSVEADYRAQGKSLDFARSISLVPGENRLAIFAENVHAAHTSEERLLIHEPDSTGVPPAPSGKAPESTIPREMMPNLYLLSVGISAYENEEMNLGFCHADAEALARVFRAQEGRMFGRVEARVLTDEAATREAVIDGLEWLEDEATQKDIVVLFLAAHGANDERGNYYLLPTGGTVEKLRRSGVSYGDFADVLGNLPSKTLMFLDTCHSGQLGANLVAFAGRGSGSAIDDATEAIRELTSDENGVIIMAASTGREDSVEHEDWGHGAFTKALIEGIEEGRADFTGDGIIHLRELDAYVSERVKELTGGVQHPTTVKPSTISRFPVARVR